MYGNRGEGSGENLTKIMNFPFNMSSEMSPAGVPGLRGRPGSRHPGGGRAAGPGRRSETPACVAGWSGEANAKIREELGLSHARLNPAKPQPFRDVPEAQIRPAVTVSPESAVAPEIQDSLCVIPHGNNPPRPRLHPGGDAGVCHGTCLFPAASLSDPQAHLALQYLAF